METDNEKAHLKVGFKGRTERKGLFPLDKGFRGWKLAQKLWILFSIPFIGFSLWKTVEENFYLRGVQEGSKRAAEVIYRDIIVKASNQECKTIFVEQKGRKVDLINIDCLRRKENSKPDGSLAKSGQKKRPKGRVN